MRERNYIQQTNTCKTYIGGVKKKCAAYLEQNTLYFESVVNINVDSDSINPQKK